MKINTKKLLLDLLIKLLVVIALFIFLCISFAKIGEALDRQAAGEQLYINAYQADLKETQNKDNTHVSYRP